MRPVHDKTITGVKSHLLPKRIPRRYRLIKTGLTIQCILLLLLFQAIRSNDSPGPLSRFHTELEGDPNCLKCHNEDYETDPERCLNCHIDLKQRISAGRGFHQDKDEGCDACHPEHQGKDSELIDWDEEDFDHEEIGFTLSGIHLKIKDCRRCHRPPNQLPRKKGRSYLMKSSHCNGCHFPPHNSQFRNCLDCHTQLSWKVNSW